MGLLEVTNLTHSFGSNVLYNNVSFELFKGEHMGFVGHNGTGKTTLMNTLIGNITPDSGDIAWQKNITVGFLDQYAKANQELSIFEYLKTAFDELYQAESRLNLLYEQMMTLSDDSLLEESSTLQELLEIKGFYELESRIYKIAAGLGITALGLDNTLNTLSGGQRAKVILAKLLLEAPDVLLLDEPTNFLDKEHIEWLVDYLKNFSGAFIVISHDFDFLDKITNCICNIEFKKITKYHGNFTKFLELKEIKKETYLREYAAQQKQILKYEDYIARNKVRASTASLAKSRQKQLDKIERLAAPESVAKPSFSFKSIPLTSEKTLVVKNLEIGYSERLLPPISFKLESGRKIVITGFNGIGKSTLLKTLVRQIPSISGGFHFANNITIGYYEQGLKWHDPNLTPIDIISQKFPNMSQNQIRSRLAQCGILAKNVLQPISSLSGGEQSKVKICLLALSPCNLLILDEPTNHLDVDCKEKLKEELINWEGSLILVSHETDFYSDWADQVLEIKSLSK
ncbi:MAG: ABC-F family ATP-binding cassette domain-containing protein [bacterium]|nr:ABC-F family ATP-binding cassette domain-containing protein [bacterium]